MKTSYLKIVCFSDTHTYHSKLDLGSGDILLFAGDVMGNGYKLQELTEFMEWFEAQDFEHKVMVAGNHDHFIEDHPEHFQSILKACPSITYLQDSGVVIGGIKIWGTPHQQLFCNWAFNQTDAFLKEAFEKIPPDTDILLSHAPALSILDHLQNRASVGEPHLRNHIFSDLHQLKFHVFGHIHNAYGTQRIWNSPQGNYYTAINCAVVNEQYQVANEPITIKYGFPERTQKTTKRTGAARVERLEESHT
jgi:Icc-related predicted phosphoesterase